MKKVLIILGLFGLFTTSLIANDSCRGFYVGQVLELKNHSGLGSLFGIKLTAEVKGVDKETGQITLKLSTGETRNGSCSSLRDELK